MKLDELLAEFTGVDPEEALEMLIDFSDSLPPVSPGRAARDSQGCRVQECQTPVDLWVDVIDGKVHLEASVPEKSPTVRGFVSMLVAGLADSTPEEIRKLPDDLLPQLGLAETLGMTRQRGFRGIVAFIKREATAPTDPAVRKGTGFFQGK
ncbi:MAG: SufE family protein [Planctomycetaceae bacterium]|nr:SufE family protein [Planctomycetaceae bacterium]